MDVSQEMCTIKQECLDNDTDHEEIDLKLIKEEPCSIDNCDGKEAETVPLVKQDIDALDISYMKNVTVDLVPVDIKFIKCEEELVFNWNANEVDPLLLSPDLLMNIKKESSPSMTNDCSIVGNTEIPVNENKHVFNDINSTGLAVQEETLQNIHKEEECESIASDHQESPTSILNTDGSDISEDTNMDENQQRSETQYKCSQCRYSTSVKCLYKVHLRTHSGRNMYQCSECSYCTTRKSHLVRHTRTHSGEKPYKCSQCSYSSSAKSSLVTHMRKHSGEKPYKCEQCSYSASVKSSLVKHIRNHSGEKPYKCSQCNYRASQKSHIVNHVRNHSGEKPYKCEQCSYSAIQKSHLVNHVRNHSDERPYKCAQCNYSASQKLHLVRHVRNHSGERPYKCAQCSYSATIKSNLVRHMKTH